MRLSASIAAFALLFASLAAAQTASAPAATAPAARLPVPDATAQARARDMIHAIFKEDFAKTTVAARLALGRRLVAEGVGTKDDANARYVLFSDGADMAATVGDSETAIQAIMDLDHYYVVDAIDLERAALMRANAAVTTPDAAETLARLCLETADSAALADAFDIVQQLANLAEAAGTKTRKVSFVAGIQVHLADLRSLAAEFAQVKQALDVLVQKPDDAAAHLAVGKFYALHKGQWEAGLPHLAAGNDADLRALALKEIAAPTDGLAQAALGDGWWDYAEKSNGLTRIYAGKHAVMWYGRSQKSLSGITRTRIEARLREGVPGGEPAKTDPKITAISPAAGASVNVLALIDPAKDSADGKWTVDGGSLVVASGKYAALQLPYAMPEEFDLRVTFTRNEGEGPIALLLASHKKTFDFAVDVKGEARFERVGYKIAKDNPTTVPIAISNGHRYTVTVQVRKDAVRALLDDKLLTQWKTDYKDFARYALWKLPDEKLCGIGANNAKVTFHSIDVIEVTGTGKPVR